MINYPDYTIFMIGWGEIILIGVIALLFLGPEKLNELARELGKLYGEYKKAKRKIELEMIYGIKPISNEELEEEIKKKYEEMGIEILDKKE